jgi:hypothetical protein
MVEGRKAVDFHQFDCKKPKAWPLHPLHQDQSPKTIKILNAYFLTKVMDSKEVWVGWEWKPKLWSRGHRFFSIKKSIIDKILAVRLEGLFRTMNEVGWSFGFGLWVWPLEASQYARPKAPNTIFLLAIFSPFIWSLNKVWSLNPTTSRLGQT